jgi:hypothetical protein
VLIPEKVHEFVDLVLLGEDRRLPVIGLSESTRSVGMRVDPERLASDLTGLAHVWVIPTSATWALSDALSPRLGAYNGAIRLWWPGLTRDDDPYSHPLWMARPGERGVSEDVVRRVLDAARTRISEPPEVEELEVRLRRAQDEALQDEINELLELATRSVDAATAVDEEERRRLEESIRAKIEQVEADREDALRDLVESETERERLSRENATLWSEVQRLRSRVGGWEPSERARTDPSSPEELFLAEVREEHETRFTPADREDYPLKELRVGRLFLAMLDQIDIPRTKVVRVCTEVAMGRAHEINGRQVHQLKASDHGGSGPRRRASDGAIAWRCYLENKTPQAGRLHWWATGDAIEFASVGPHDDVDIPE